MDNQVIIPEQFAFQKGSSTQSALLSSIDYVINSLDQGKYVAGLFLDLKKAFDVIDYDILLVKLKHYGVRDLNLRWFESYLSERYQFTVVNGEQSEMKPVTHGIPQGSILGTLLFLIYVNDITNASDVLKLVLFADDTNAFHSDFDKNNLVRTLNTELSKINEWINVNLLTVNLTKTHFLIFSKRNVIQFEGNVMLNNNIVERKHETKFLGIIVDEKLKWDNHIQYISTKISKNIGVIDKMRNALNHETKNLLYYSLVYPYLHYCSTVWGSANKTNLNPLTILQKRIIRIIRGTNYRHHTNELFKNSKILKLTDIIKLQ